MSLLGKILLGINFLLAAGVVYLAAQSWGKREDINVALIKQELAESGVPFSGSQAFATSPEATVPFPMALTSGRTLTDLRAGILIDVFAGAVRGGELTGAQVAPPLSILAELDEAKKRIDAKIAGLSGKPDAGLLELIGTTANNGQFRPRLLSLLADDFEDRQMYRAWLDRVRKEPAEAPKLFKLAQAAIDRKFNEAIQPASAEAALAAASNRANAREAVNVAYQQWSQARIEQFNAASATLQKATDTFWEASVAPAPASSEVERKRIAAALLLHLDSSASGQKRTALVLGLPTYIRALNDRLARLNDMPSQLRDTQKRELSTFVVLYERDLQASRDLDRLVTTQKKTTASLLTAADEAKQNYNQHEALLKAAIQRSEEITAKVKEKATEQAALELAVFELHQQVGSLLTQTYTLQDRVLEAERKRLAK